MAFEDGLVLFQHYYGGGGGLFVFYAGYVSVVPDLVGWLACRLPVTWIPGALGLFPLLLTAVVPVEVARVLRGFGVSGVWALGVGAAAVVMPLGSWVIESSTIYAYCHLLFLIVLWSIAHLRGGEETSRAWWVLAPLFMASHPLSVAVVPVYALALWQQRSRVAAARLAYVAGVSACYVTFGMESGIGAGLDFGMLGAALSTWLGRVWFEVFLGGVARAELWGSAPWAVWLVGAVIAGAVSAGIARARGEARTALAVAFGYTALLTGMVVVARWASPAASLEDFLHGRRYLHVQQLLVVVMVGWTLAIVLKGRAPSRVALAVGAAWILLLNTADAIYFENTEKEGLEARAFVAELARLEAAGAQQRPRLERGEWSVEVDVR